MVSYLLELSIEYGPVQIHEPSALQGTKVEDYCDGIRRMPAPVDRWTSDLKHHESCRHLKASAGLGRCAGAAYSRDDIPIVADQPLPTDVMRVNIQVQSNVE